MHEQALTEKILRIVLREAAAHQIQRVTKITLAIGELSGIVPESVELFFQLLAQGTAAADGQLEFKTIKALLYCSRCQREFEKPARDFCCPACGELGRLTQTGQEFLIESIEAD